MYKQKGFDSGNGGGKKKKKTSGQDPKNVKSGTVTGQYLMRDSDNMKGPLGLGAVDVDTGRFYADPDQFLRTDELGFIPEDEYGFNDRGIIITRNDSTGTQIYDATQLRKTKSHRNKLKKNEK